ncbi:MAG: hypothetical protein Tsb0014_21230 [Pleurocapsa sp.]
MKLSTLFLYSSLLLGLTQTSAMGFTIDLFTDANDTYPSTSIPYQKIEATGVFGSTTATTVTHTGLNDVLWGQRQLDLTVSSSEIGAGTIEVFGSPLTKASINSDSSATVDLAKFTWGSDDNTTYVDITDSVNGNNDNAFNLTVLKTDLTNGVDITFTVTDSAGLTGSVSQNVDSTGTVSFLYQDISNETPSIQLGSIKKIEMSATNAPEAIDFEIDFLETGEVPFEFSPSMGIILLGSFLGISKLRKKLQHG